MKKHFFNLLQDAWQAFCRAIVRIFYRHVEIEGLEHLPQNGAVLICANHANALADALILQATLPRLLHPIARSGLFKNWLLKPFMITMQAVPVYRRQDNDGSSDNTAMFQRCYEMFEQGEVLLIFPEGQSHSDPSLRPIKTGAARMILGCNGKSIPLTVLPVGLTFSNKGKFRSNVLVKLGEPMAISSSLNEDAESVHILTNEIQLAIEAVTINVEKADELDFLKRVERFFAMRHGKYRHRNMALRFEALQKINNAYQKLCEHAPNQLLQLRQKLHQFERLCLNCKINAYQVTVRYTPLIVTRFILRILTILLLILPVAAWGIVNSYIPYFLTRLFAKIVSKDTDQYDTAKMSFGLVLFPLFWLTQIWWLNQYVSTSLLLAYIISLPISAIAALYLRKEHHHIWDNLRGFFLFLRKRKLKEYLEHKRHKLERELARLVRIAKQL